jgi:hypothetical protein
MNSELELMFFMQRNGDDLQHDASCLALSLGKSDVAVSCFRYERASWYSWHIGLLSNGSRQATPSRSSRGGDRQNFHLFPVHHQWHLPPSDFGNSHGKVKCDSATAHDP